MAGDLGFDKGGEADVMGHGRLWQGPPWKTALGHLGIGAFPALWAAEWSVDAGMPVVGVVVVFGLVLVAVGVAIAVAGDISTRKEWPEGARLTPAERREVDAVVMEGGCPDDLRLVPAARELALLRAGDEHDSRSPWWRWLTLLTWGAAASSTSLSMGLPATAAMFALTTVALLVLSLGAPTPEENRRLSMQAAHAARARLEEDEPVVRPR